MLKRIAGSVAALTIAVAGLGLVGTAAQAQEAGAVVTAVDIAPNETQENYTTWHQGATPGGRYASTVDGLLVTGNTQIIKGETVLPAVGELLAYAKSSKVVSTGGPVWHQIGFGLDNGEWTTLRAQVGAESGNWTTSQAFNGFGRNAQAPLDDLLAGLTGNLTYLSGGFYVDQKVPATISSYAVNAVTTSFALGALNTTPQQTEYVLDTGIRPYETEEEYVGWHDGAEAGGTYVSTPDGLKVGGKAQILNGELNSSTQVAQFVTGLAIETTSQEVWYQVPVQSEAGFTTLRATPDMAAAGNWVTSRAIGALAANSQAPINDIALELGAHSVIGYGFFVDTGKTATVKSITANGKLTDFAKKPFTPRPDLPGVGIGQGIDVAPPAAVGTIKVKQGAAVRLVAPEGIFVPGESVTVTLHSKATALGSFASNALNGAVDGSATVPANTPVGTHRVLFQGANSYYWAPAAFVVTAADTGNAGNTGGTGGTGNGTVSDKDPAKAGGAKGQQLAVSGSEQNLLPVALGGVALALGAGLMLLRRRAR